MAIGCHLHGYKEDFSDPNGCSWWFVIIGNSTNTGEFGLEDSWNSILRAAKTDWLNLKCSCHICAPMAEDRIYPNQSNNLNCPLPLRKKGVCIRGSWLIGQQIVPKASLPTRESPVSSMNYIEFTRECDLLKSEYPKIHNSANCKTCKPKCSMGKY